MISRRSSVDAFSKSFVVIESSDFEKFDDFVEKSSSSNEKSFFSDEFFAFVSASTSAFAVTQLAISSASVEIQKRSSKVRVFSFAFLFLQVDEFNSNI